MSILNINIYDLNKLLSPKSKISQGITWPTISRISHSQKSVSKFPHHLVRTILPYSKKTNDYWASFNDNLISLGFYTLYHNFKVDSVTEMGKHSDFIPNIGIFVLANEFNSVLGQSTTVGLWGKWRRAGLELGYWSVQESHSTGSGAHKKSAEKYAKTTHGTKGTEKLKLFILKVILYLPL